MKTQLCSSLVKGTWRWVDRNITVRTVKAQWDFFYVKSHHRVLKEIHHLWEIETVLTHLKQCELWLCITVKKTSWNETTVLRKVINQPSLCINSTTQRVTRHEPMMSQTLEKYNAINLNQKVWQSYFVVWAFGWTQKSRLCPAMDYISILKKVFTEGASLLRADIFPALRNFSLWWQLVR